MMKSRKSGYSSDLIAKLLEMGFSLSDIMLAMQLYKDDTVKIIDYLQQKKQIESVSEETFIHRRRKPVIPQQGNCASSMLPLPPPPPLLRCQRNLPTRSRTEPLININRQRWGNLYQTNQTKENETGQSCDEDEKCEADNSENNVRDRPDSIDKCTGDEIEYFHPTRQSWVDAIILIPVDDTNICIEINSHNDDKNEVKIVRMSEIRTKQHNDETTMAPSTGLCQLSSEYVADNPSTRRKLKSKLQRLQSNYKQWAKRCEAYGSRVQSALHMNDTQWAWLVKFVSLALQIGLNIICPGLCNLIKAVSKFLKGDYKGALLCLMFGLAQLISFGLGQIDTVEEFCELLWDGLSEIDAVRDIAETMLSIIKPVATEIIGEIDGFFLGIQHEILPDLQVLFKVHDLEILNEAAVKPLMRLCAEINICLDKVAEAVRDEALDDRMLQKLEKFLVKQTQDLIEEIPIEVTRQIAKRSSHLKASEQDIEDCEIVDVEEKLQEIIMNKVIQTMPTALQKDIDVEILKKLSIFNVCSEHIHPSTVADIVYTEEQLDSHTVLV